MDVENNTKLPFFTPFVEYRRYIDCSVLYIIKRPFDLLHAHIADIRFFSKSAVDPKYCLLIVGLFTSKIYTYPIKSKNLLLRK